MNVRQDKKLEIRNAWKSYERMIENLYEEMIFELSMKLHLEEETVRKVLDEVV